MAVCHGLLFRVAEAKFLDYSVRSGQGDGQADIYSSPDSFLAFFFLFLLALEPVDLAKGRSRILRISSSSIFLSVLNLDRSG